MTTKTKSRTGSIQTPPSRAYRDDLYGWVQDQVALLKVQEVGSIDALHITQELRELGLSEFKRLASATRVTLLHLIKWDYQPERRSRSWLLTIDEQRCQIAETLRANPGLKPRREGIVKSAYAVACRVAARETGLPRAAFPTECPYRWEDIIRREISLDGETSPDGAGGFE
jgi:hypothetical protein